MTTNFPTPPTFASPVVVNEQNGQNQFNPIWLQWFLVLAQFLEGTTVGRLKDIIVITSTGIYNPSSGVNNILAFAWGGGGSGGAAAATAGGQVAAGGGGGAGAMAWGLFTSGFSGQIFTQGTRGLIGSDGGASTFMTLNAAGGKAGVAGASITAPGFTAGGEGGVSSGGLLTAYGTRGGAAILQSVTQVMSGEGAHSVWGAGGKPSLVQGPGNSATGYVAGGGGALSLSGGAGYNGGAGGYGCGLILELS